MSQDKGKGLSLEQQFELRAFEQKVQSIDERGAKQLLVALYKSKMIQGNILQGIIKDAWGIDEGLQGVLEA
ncbi:MAG: NblA/ycf18 family protein [Microcoleaceae cyanobacterium]